jgi:signal transduction histidine kinase
MLLSASPEFVDLCEAQLWLLVRSLGASTGVVYLTEDIEDSSETRLVQIAAVPDEAIVGIGEGGIVLPPPSSLQGNVSAMGGATPAMGKMAPRATLPLSPRPSLVQPDRLVLPLMHDEMVLGLLVTERIDRNWTVRDRQQIEPIIQTLSLAYVLDQRSQWLQQRQQQQLQLRAQQHDLLDNLIHQFRNPLTALRTFGKLLLKRLPESDRSYDAAASIIRESDRLQELLLQIDRLIDRAEPLPDEVTANPPAALPVAGTLGEQQLVLQPCDVREILRPLVVSAAAVAQEKQLALHTELPDAVPLVNANPSALREVLSNLIDNAVKYTPAGGQVHVCLRVDDGQVLVSITDNGQGIPDQDLPHLFQRHFRGVQAQTDVPGTGLGLAIARELVQQMQGDIQVWSPMQMSGWLSDERPTTRGVTFLVTLPAMT